MAQTLVGLLVLLLLPISIARAQTATADVESVAKDALRALRTTLPGLSVAGLRVDREALKSYAPSAKDIEQATQWGDNVGAELPGLGRAFFLARAVARHSFAPAAGRAEEAESSALKLECAAVVSAAAATARAAVQADLKTHKPRDVTARLARSLWSLAVSVTFETASAEDHEAEASDVSTDVLAAISRTPDRNRRPKDGVWTSIDTTFVALYMSALEGLRSPPGNLSLPRVAEVLQLMKPVTGTAKPDGLAALLAMCEEFVHPDDVAGYYLESEVSDVQESSAGVVKRSKATITFSNPGPQRLVGKTSVVLFDVVEDDAGDYELLADVKTFAIDLAPGVSSRASLELSSRNRKGGDIKVLRSPSEGAPASVRRVGPRVALQTCVERLQASSETADMGFSRPLLAYAMDARNDFRNLRSSDSLISDGKLSLDGADSVLVMGGPRGWTVYATYYDGPSLGLATKAAEALAARVESMCGGTGSEVEIDEDTKLPSYWVKMFSPDVELTVGIRRGDPTSMQDGAAVGASYRVDLTLRQHGLGRL